MGCQKGTAQQIVNSNAGYVLGLKGNQGNTFEAVKLLFSCEEKDGFKNVPHTIYETLEKNHGRLETRTVYSANIVDGMEELKEWAGLKSVTRVVSRREVMGSTPTEERRYCLSSLEADAESTGKAVRAH